jgi:hypothetical protein
MDKSSDKSTEKGKKTELKKGSTKKAGNRRQIVTATTQRLTSKPRGSQHGTTITESCYLRHLINIDFTHFLLS